VSENRDDDAALDAFLARETALQRRWRERAEDEPAPALDESVRAAARRAVKHRGRASHPAFTARWRVPLSIAALVVISTTVTLMVAERRAHVPDAGFAPPPAAMVEPAVPTAPSPVAPATPEAPQAQKSKPAPRLSAPSAAKRSADAEPAPGSASGEVAEPERPRTDAPKELAKTGPADLGAGVARPAQPAPAERDALKDEAPARDLRAQPAVPAREGPTAPPQATSAEAQLREAPAGPAAGAPAASAERKADAPAVPATAPAKEMRSRRLQRAEPSAQSMQSEDADLSVQNDPQRWVERIRALRAAGKLEQAQASLREFRKRYPDYPLPSDLEALR
jgi:hypothetical protein